ncbi:MAG: ABC transporter substrate-binding protein [Cyanobacteria bacterium P01_F01_bin.116]
MAPKNSSRFQDPDSEFGLAFSIKVFLISAGMLSLMFLGIRWLVGGRPLSLDQSQPPAQQSPTPTATLSQGERILLTQSSIPLKERGVAAIAASNYEAAVSALSAAHTRDPADPETLIYLNNARINNRPGEQTAHEIAVIVPAALAPATATSVLRGVAQAQTQINQANGIQGKPLRLILGDDQGKVEIAREIATQLSQSVNLMGVIGHDSVTTAKAAMEVYKDNQLSLISTSTDIKPQPLASPMVSDNSDVAKALADYMIKLNYRRVTLLYDGTHNNSDGFRASFETAYKGDTLEQINLANVQKITAKSLNTDVLLLSPGKRSLKQATEPLLNNNSQIRIFGGQEIFDPEVLDQLGPLADTLILAVPDRLYQSAASPFSDRPLKLWRSLADLTTTASYNAAQSMIWGLKQSPNREGVNQAIATIDNSTIRLLKVSVNNDAIVGYELLPIGIIKDSQLKSN